MKTRQTRRSLGSPVTRRSCPHSTQNHHKSTWNNIPLLFNWHPKSRGEIYVDTYRDAITNAGLQLAVASHTPFFFFKTALFWLNQRKVKDCWLENEGSYMCRNTLSKITAESHKQEQGFLRALRYSFIGKTSNTAVNATITMIHITHRTLSKTFHVD